MADRGEALGGRRVLLYVSGSVAAFKACEVVTLLRRRGAEVRVAMTDAGARFVAPMTFRSLSGHPVTTGLWEAPSEAAPAGAGHGMAHLDLAGWAEIQAAAPASADLLARLALGLAGDAVCATALACPAPLVIAPAMETAMWRHPATQTHVATLRERGATLVGPDAGRLASGEEGVGRMASPAAVVETIVGLLGAAAAPGDRWLTGRHVVVTAGGTREPIDAVRFIGNSSSGKMGAALAGEALRLGARVTLVSAGPVVGEPVAGLEVVEATTAARMLEAVRRCLPGASALVMAAAVADYRPAEPAARKLKKRGEPLTLELVPTDDVLTAVRDDAVRQGVLMVGFAAETDNLLANARRKLENKGLDLIVANDVGVPGIGMSSDHNAVTVLGRDGLQVDIPRMPKAEVARRIFAVMRQVAPASPASNR